MQTYVMQELGRQWVADRIAEATAARLARDARRRKAAGRHASRLAAAVRRRKNSAAQTAEATPCGAGV
jgi:hypothetical protein